jgi:hypothetical protein
MAEAGRSKRKYGGVSPKAPIPGAAAHSDFKYNNGSVIRCPRVYTTFWGPGWSDAAHTARATRLNHFLRDLLASTYMNVLSQYGAGQGANTGMFIGATFVANVKSQIDKSDIAAVIQDCIDAGTIPEPNANNNGMVLVIYLDESIAVDETGLRMCEPTSDNAFGFHSDLVTKAGNEFYYAVIPALDDNCVNNSCPGGSTCSLRLTETQEQRLTQVTSHEFAEMITDPKFTEGWYGSSSDENGDICNGQSATITVGPNTWTVQRQYSKTDDENSNGANYCVVGAASLMPLRADGPAKVAICPNRNLEWLMLLV